MYYSAPFRKFSSISVFRVRDPGFGLLSSSSSSFTERGLTFHLRPPRGRLPFSSSLSLSLTVRHYSLLPACVMRAGQNGIADKSRGTGRRSDKVRLDIRAVRKQQSLLSLFFSYAFSWLEDSSSPFLVGPARFWLFPGDFRRDTSEEHVG